MEHQPSQPSSSPPGDDEAVLPVDLRDWVDFSADAPRRVRVFGTTTMTQDLWCVQPSQATAVLRYDAGDVTYTVIGGRARVVTDQGEVGLDPLASVLVPAGVSHGIDNRGADPLVVLAVTAPPSDDAGADQPLTRLAAAIDQPSTTGTLAQRLLAFVAGRR